MHLFIRKARHFTPLFVFNTCTWHTDPQQTAPESCYCSLQLREFIFSFCLLAHVILSTALHFIFWKTTKTFCFMLARKLKAKTQVLLCSPLARFLGVMFVQGNTVEKISITLEKHGTAFCFQFLHSIQQIGSFVWTCSKQEE